MGGVAIVVGRVRSGYWRDISAAARLHAPGAARHVRDLSARRSSASSTTGSEGLHERNLGLNKRAKIVGLLIVAVGFAVLAVNVANVDTHTVVHPLDSPGPRSRARRLGACSAIFLIIAATNAVNLTDGLDGLAAGSSIFGFAAFTVIGFWQFRHTHLRRRPTPSTWLSSPRSMIGGLRRLPVVERGTGPDLHGRHRLAGHRCRPRRPGARHEHACCCCRSSAACSSSRPCR